MFGKLKTNHELTTDRFMSEYLIKTQKCLKKTSQTITMELLAKIVNGFQSLTIFAKNLYLRRLTVF